MRQLHIAIAANWLYWRHPYFKRCLARGNYPEKRHFAFLFEADVLKLVQ